MVSRENLRTVISVVAGLLVLLGLAEFTSVSTFVRLPTALIVVFLVQRMLETAGY